MSDRVVAVIGALAIALAALGLAADGLRAGPVEVALSAPVLDVEAVGEVVLQGDRSVLGVCPEPDGDCAPHTFVELHFIGLPDVPMSARWTGGDEFGYLEPVEGGHLLEHDAAEDRTDAEGIQITVAGQPVMELPLTPGPQDTVVDQALEARWADLAGRVHLDQIGAVSVSTVASMSIQATPPEGWVFVARLHDLDQAEPGRQTVSLGSLAVEGGHATLDGRVERMHLGDQDRFTIQLLPEADTSETEGDRGPLPQGVPVLAGSL